jgi:molybdopterin converting factor small subunit
VRKRDIIKNIKFSGKKLSGPEAITPIGIAITAVDQQGNDFLYVSLNGRKIRLFNTKKLTVADSLILIGFNPSQLIGRTGKSISFTLNGEDRLVRGEHGKPAEIYINNKPSSLDAVLSPADEITVKPSIDGKNAVLALKDVIGTEPRRIVTINGKVQDISIRAHINGNEVSWDSFVNDGDSIVLEGPFKLKEIAEKYMPGIDIADITVNGLKPAADYILEDSDSIGIIPKKTGIDLIQDDKKIESGSITENILNRGRYVIVNGNKIALGDKAKYIFVDIFNIIDFDITKPQGNIILRLNGHPAAFTDEISTGDTIDIYWEK